MREYIVAFKGVWLHFFIKQNIGLCWRKKEGFKFGEKEVLLKGAQSDFCVFGTEDDIHVACQDSYGSVLYLVYDGVSWKKSVLLENRTARPYQKNFQFVCLSGHITLLYVIENKERFMLVHHTILEGSSPFVVDYIKKSSVPFCTVSHMETDFTIFYTNEEGKSGYKIYKWSQKSYSDFEVLSKEDAEVKYAEKDESGNITVVATKKTDDILALMQFSFDEKMNINQEIPIYLDCQKEIVPIISHYGDKEYIVWTEYGGVVASHKDNAGKWSKPVRYAKSNSADALLYVIYDGREHKCFYGTPREYDIILYGTHDILKNAPALKSPKRTEKIEDSVLREQAEQIKKIYEELAIQRKKLSYLADRISEIVSSVPIADEEDIDKILLS